MIAHKQIDDIAKLIIGLAVIFCLMLALAAPALTEALGGKGVSMEYEQRMFDTSEPMVIDIQIDPDDWQDMLDTAQREEYHRCDVVINGTTFQSVGIRPKGNTSLSSIAMDPDNDRYSFKIEFDQYVDGQTAWGLDKLCLNNNYADATNMKEALVYDMYRFLEVDASLYNYAKIYVNGEYWGVYLAIEAVEDSFMLRNFGTEKGALYKPDSMGIGGFGGSDDDGGFPDFGDDFPFPDFSASEEPAETPEPTATPDLTATPEPTAAPASEEEKPGVTQNSGENASSSSSFDFDFDFDFGGGPFGGSGGQNLNYTDDDLDSYSTIWQCETTDTTEADHKRVVAALKNISEGVELEESMDIDNLLRMMAVHNFSVNGDSLSGGMAHNYYLYESGGQLNILPWDYNLALGGMGMGGSDATEIVNDPIDDSWQATSFFDPLLENEEYLAKYHEYYQKLVDEYIFGGGFDAFYTRTRGQIDTLVATDPNALYDYDVYDTAADTLYRLVKLRGESIRGQLDGTIPSTTQTQRLDSAALVDASGIDTSVMGGMGFGGGGFGPFSSDEPDEDAAETSDASDEISDTSDADIASAEINDTAGTTETAASAEPAQTVETTASAEPETDNTQASAEFSFPDFGNFPFSSGEMDEEDNSQTIWLLAACGIVLVGGIVFAVVFGRKRRL